MSIKKYIEISCDVCGDTFHGHSVAEVTKEARKGGWTINGKIVKCDICKVGKS